MDFSLIVPSYNEEGNIAVFLETATRVFDVTDLDYEIVVVNDGSSDGTLAVLHDLQAKQAFAGSRADIRVVNFSRNFGKEAALFAGLEAARGDLMGFIDADMQQRPETSLQMLEYLREHPDCDCVAAVQAQRREGAVLKFFKRSFYRVFNSVTETELIASASDFRVFRRNVAEALLSMKEYYRFSKGLFGWIGFNVHTIEYEADARLTGTSNWSFTKLMSYALGGITSFTTAPLHLVLWLGAITCIIAVIGLVAVLAEVLSSGIITPGYPTIVCLILLFSGIVMLSLGIFGEYLGRVYIEGKHRPIYIARDSFSVNEADIPHSGDVGKQLDER